MTIQNRHKETLLQYLKEAIRKDTLWMDYPASEKVLRPRTVSFHKTPDEAKERARVWSKLFGAYKILPVPPLFQSLRLQLRLESFGIVQASPLRIDAERMTERFLQKKQLPADLLTKNTSIVGTSHVLTDELFNKALVEISNGNQVVVYDASRHLLGLQEMRFLKDEAAAKLFIGVYAPSGDNIKMFKASSLMDIYDHFEVSKQIEGMAERLPHLVSDEVLSQAMAAMQHGNHFIAYNSFQHFLENGDVQFFKDKDEALEFSMNNISEYDNFDVIKIGSLDDFHDHFQIDHPKNETISSQSKNTNMNDKNLDDLSKRLLYTGFGETLNEQLKAKLLTGEKDFVLTHEAKYGKDEVAAALQFRRADTGDNYYFNRYNLMLKNEQYPDPIKQTFYINPMQDNITLKEAYNMMSGRAVHKDLENKEGEKYKAWVQLDFKETDTNGNYKTRSFNQNYGFDLDTVLAKYPIPALLHEEQKKSLTESLERGNRQSVMLEKDGKQLKVFMEAAPQYKSMNIYDENGKKLLPNELNAKLSEGEKKNSKISDVDVDRKQGQKNNVQKPDDDIDKRKQGQKVKM